MAAAPTTTPSAQQNTTGINENMSLAETRQQALDAYNAGQISEQDLDQILDDIDAQEELNGSGISLEVELNRLNREPAAQHSIGTTVDGKPFVTIEEDILDGVPESEWVKTVKSNLKKKFPNGVTVGRNQIQIDRQSRKEMTFSKYMQWLRNADPQAYSDKLRATNNADEILVATTDWVNEGLKHPRQDTIQDFSRGNVLLRVGRNDYSAEVVVGYEKNGRLKLYEIINLNPATITEKETSAAITENPSPGTDRSAAPISNGSVPQGYQNVNAQHSISAPAERQSIIRDLRSILDRGGNPNELRRYVTRLEQGTQTADQTASVSGREGTEAQQILQAARDRGIGVEEYLEQNWERYDVDGQWNADAREALELEQGQSRRQHSISAPVNRMTDAEIQAVQNIGGISVNQFSAADIQATKRFALQYWKEMGVRSPFFRAWFGDWRENDQTPVQIATQKGNARGVQKNTDTGWDVQVSGKVFNETKVHTDSFNIAARPYLPYINDIVRKAVLLDSYGIEQGKEKSVNSLLMHSLYTVADIGNGPEIIKLYVEEMNNPNTQSTGKRAYQLQDVEKYQPTGKSSQKSASSISPVATGNIKTIADLFAAVKQKDARFNPNQASKVVNADGTPKAVYHGSADLFDTFSYGHIGSASGVSVLGDGFYFTDQKKLAKNYGENVYECYLQMKTPYMANAADSYRLNTTQLKAQGYDGVILNAPNGNVYMVFDNTQIKSATDNIGTFDGNDPNIRHSISEAPGTEIDQDIAGDIIDENEVDDVRSVLPKKARDYLKRTERTLLNSISRNLGVPWFAQREYLQPMVEEISNEYLKNGTVSKETVDRLFDTAYDEGIVVDREFYDQYKDIKDYLRTTAVTLSESHREDIADFGDFRKRNFGTLRIVNQGGSAVDSVYEELRRMAPELFPADITHPADQLVRMADVGKSIQIAEYSIQYYYGKNADAFRKVARNDFETAIGDVTSELQKVKRYHEERQAVAL